MKAYSKLWMWLFVVVVMFSCKKTAELQNETLVGKWKLIQTFDGYANGGNFEWRVVESGKAMEFFDNGEFLEKETYGGQEKTCKGNFRMYAGNKLELKSDCQTGIQNFVLSKQVKSQIIIDLQGREGVVRQKYLRVLRF